MVKKPKLTAAERKELKLQKKKAKKLKLEEQKRKIQRDALARDIKYGELNRRTLEKSWIRMATDIILPVLKTEFQLAVNNAELMLDCKDIQISLLLDELDVAEVQYKMNFCAHYENMHNMLEIYSQRLDDLRSEYTQEYEDLTRRGRDEKSQLQQKISSDHEHINTMIYHLDQEHKNISKDLRTNYLSKLNEELSRNKTDMQALASSREQTFEKIWHSYKNMLRDYMFTTADRRKESNALHKQDAFMTELIAKQSIQLQKLQVSLIKLKEVQINDNENLDKYVKYKVGERDYFFDTYQKLRNNFHTDLKLDNVQMTCLVAKSNDSIKTLEKKGEQSENVLKMYSIIRKRETRYEKIFPFPKSAPNVKVKNVLVADSKYKFSVEAPNLKNFESFWMKCGQGDTTRHILLDERERLRNENAFLKQCLQKYCSNRKYTSSELYANNLKKFKAG